MTKVKDLLEQENKEAEKSGQLEAIYESELDQIFSDDTTTDKEKILLFLNGKMFEKLIEGVDRDDLKGIRDDITAKVEATEFKDRDQFRMKMFSIMLRSIADWIDKKEGGTVNDGQK